MISVKTTPCRGFDLGVGSALPGDVFTQPDTRGIDMQYVYFYRGHGTVTDGENVAEMPGKKLMDLTQYMGKETNFTMLGDPTMWISVSPIPTSDRFDAEFVGEGKSLTVNGGAKRKAILCLEGSILCNGTSVEALKYVSIKDSTRVTINVPQGAAAVVLTTL